jgi:hypothetical protein
MTMRAEAGVYSREIFPGITEVTAVGPDGLELKKITARTELITEQEQEDLWQLVDDANAASTKHAAGSARAQHAHPLRILK